MESDFAWLSLESHLRWDLEGDVVSFIYLEYIRKQYA